MEIARQILGYYTIDLRFFPQLKQPTYGFSNLLADFDCSPAVIKS